MLTINWRASTKPQRHSLPKYTEHEFAPSKTSNDIYRIHRQVAPVGDVRDARGLVAHSTAAADDIRSVAAVTVTSIDRAAHRRWFRPEVVPERGDDVGNDEFGRVLGDELQNEHAVLTQVVLGESARHLALSIALDTTSGSAVGRRSVRRLDP